MALVLLEVFYNLLYFVVYWYNRNLLQSRQHFKLRVAPIFHCNCYNTTVVLQAFYYNIDFSLTKLDRNKSWRSFPNSANSFSSKNGYYIQYRKLTPIKQTNSSLHTVLLGLLMDGGQCGPRPSQKLESRQPLSSRHLSPNLSWHSDVQHGPCDHNLIDNNL